MASGGSFEVVEIRAAGAYGTVVLARRRADDLQRVVALKVLRGTLVSQASMLTRSRDEARLLSRIHHPNVVRVEELLEVERRPVVVMEAVEGIALSEILGRHRDGIPVPVVLEVARRTARALHDLYNWCEDGAPPLHLIHRDVKPGNLLLSLHGEVKVVDFGVSRGEFPDRETSTISTVLGSQGYISPERFLGLPDGPEVDVYSLGVTMFELLTGRLPILPREERSHQIGRDHALQNLGLIPEGPREALIPLLRVMLDWNPETRPSAARVRRKIEEIQTLWGLSDGLREFARQEVEPQLHARVRVDPREHPAWEEVSFLEREPDPKAEPDEVDLQRAADLQLRRFLSQPDWPAQRRELRWLLARETHWTAEPFLDILRQAKSYRWWRFWTSPPSDAEIAVSLDVLKHRRSPAVVEVAAAFEGTGVDAVESAVRVLLNTP